MIKNIVAVQKTDEAVSALIGNRIYPFHSSDTSQDSIAYTPVPLEDDGVKETWRVEITIISKSLENSMTIDTAIRNALLTIADAQLTDSIMQVTLNGGASLYNYETNTYHITGYYYITYRK